MKLFVFIVGFLSFSSAMFASADENPTLKRVLELYKRKDFKEINKIASEYIRSQEELSQDDKVIKVYFHTENDLQKLDTVLDQIYKNTDELSPKFHTLTYMLMEKTLLAEQYDIGVKWGDIYRKEAKSKKTKYIKGLYLYSCLLYKANKSTISLSVIDNALKEKPNKKITTIPGVKKPVNS